MEHITDRLSRAKWGVFNHYLSGIQNNPGHLNNQGAGETSWDECVHALDVEKSRAGSTTAVHITILSRSCRAWKR